jgi:hypothetical protein
MARWLSAGGVAAGSVGVALIVPAFVSRLERGSFVELAIVVATVGSTLIVGGLAAVVLGALAWGELIMPAGVRIAVMANIVFLACFALEISDGLTRRGGVIHPIGWTMFGPTLLLLCGLLSARRWAWWIARGVAVICIVWFLGFAVLIPFADLRTEQGPVPWWGRIYMVCVSLILTGVLTGGFLSLGATSARSYFGSAATKA